ncbi:protein DVR-1 [Amia ocellicauda]|uniref:protein DVR-1 n=1 Tax=Amia ocellicauda TaxID=2972642 RepID=UPI003464BE0A
MHLLRRAGHLGFFIPCVVLFCSAQEHTRPSLVPTREALQLEAVKKGILDSLGLDAPPVPRERATREELRRMYWVYKEESERLWRNSSLATDRYPSAQNSTILLPAVGFYFPAVQPLHMKTEQKQGTQVSQRFRVLFHRTDLIRNELSLVRAELKLYEHLREEAKIEGVANETQVNVYQPCSMERGCPGEGAILVASKVLDSENIRVDIRGVVEEWRSSSQETWELEVELVTWSPRQTPQIVLELGPREEDKMGGKGRTKRSAEEDCQQDESRCCRKSLRVSFKEIGWSDWVLAPETFTMYFCDGSCPHNYKPASMHAQIKARMHHISNGATPPPCCVPAAYKPMILMHYDSEGKPTLSPFEDMVVSKCHCA